MWTAINNQAKTGSLDDNFLVRASTTVIEYEKILNGDYVAAGVGDVVIKVDEDPFLTIKNELVANNGADYVVDLEEIASFLKRRK